MSDIAYSDPKRLYRGTRLGSVQAWPEPEGEPALTVSFYAKVMHGHDERSYISQNINLTVADARDLASALIEACTDWGGRVMDSTFIPELIRDSAPRHATRLDLVSATRRSQALASADAQQKAAEAFEAADDLLRALRRFQALHTGRPQEMRDWLCDVSGGAIDQLGNVMGAVDRDLEEQGLNPAEPLDLSELYAFWKEVS